MGNKADLREIVKLEAKRLEKRLAERQMTMSVTDAALDYLAEIGFDPVYGARPLKRVIQRQLETSVAQGILRGDYNDGDTVLVDVEDDQLKISIAVDAEVEDEESDSPVAEVESEETDSPVAEVESDSES